MLVVLIVAGLAVAIAVVRGGSLEALAATRFRWTSLLVTALIVQVVFDIWSPAGVSESSALALLLTTNLGVVAFLVLNRSLPGMLAAGVGLALNVVVIAANGGMPVSQQAVRAAGVEAEGGELGLKHEVIDDDTKLRPLADVIVVPLVNEVLSVGDLVLAAGIAHLVYARTLSPAQ